MCTQRLVPLCPVGFAYALWHICLPRRLVQGICTSPRLCQDCALWNLMGIFLCYIPISSHIYVQPIYTLHELLINSGRSFPSIIMQSLSNCQHVTKCAHSCRLCTLLWDDSSSSWYNDWQCNEIKLKLGWGCLNERRIKYFGWHRVQEIRKESIKDEIKKTKIVYSWMIVHFLSTYQRGSQIVNLRLTSDN